MLLVPAILYDGPNATPEGRALLAWVTVICCVVWLVGYYGMLEGYDVLNFANWWPGAQWLVWGTGLAAPIIISGVGRSYCQEGIVGCLIGIPLILTGWIFGWVNGLYFILIGCVIMAGSVAVDLVKGLGGVLRGG